MLGSFLLLYIFAIYSPIIPNKKICTPPKKYIGIIVEAQPEQYSDLHNNHKIQL